VAKVFTSNGRKDPRYDLDGHIAFILQRQCRGYQNTDPGVRHEKPLPVELLQRMVQRPDGGVAVLRHFHRLTIFAFFFAMRSCEYLLVTSDESQRRTRPLRLRNFLFLRGHRRLDHSSDDLVSADSITITFEWQKRDDRDDQVTQSRTPHRLLCPVKTAAAIVKYIRSIGGTDDTPIYTYRHHTYGNLCHLTGSQARDMLRKFVEVDVDPDESWGFNHTQIGLHSLRSSAAMAMYLNGIPTPTIMLLGRWSSDAVMRYIRKTVVELGSKVSVRMIQNPAFHQVPTVDRNDPRSHNPLSAAANYGMGYGRPINRGAFAVWE
jgi:integrase